MNTATLPLKPLPAGHRLLFLLRHAKAESSAISDHARPLAETGMQDALALGERWKSTLPWPSHILCSDALRTRQTLTQLCAGAGTPAPTSFEPDLYEASPGAALAKLQALPAECERVLMVGHNPTIHQMAAMLACAPGLHSPTGRELLLGYPPGTLTVLVLPEALEWHAISPASLDLHGLHLTKRGWLFT